LIKNEAIHKALKVLNCLNNDRVYETAWVKGAINACEKALEQPAKPRLVSYALDGSTCTLNIDGEEVYFNREQPAQKPVFWMHEVEEAPFEGHQVTVAPKQDDYYTIPLYTHPHQWQGLTDDEIKSFVCGNAGATALFYMLKDDVIGSNYRKCIESFARAIEQALKEKNYVK